MKSIIEILILFVLVGVLLSFIYIEVYKRRIEKRLKEGLQNKSHKTMLAPHNFNVFLTIFMVVVFIATLLFPSIKFSPVENYKNSKVEIQACGENDLTTLLDKENEIPGYSKSEKIEHNYRYIIYRNNNSSSAFPDCMLYIEYLENEYNYFGCIADCNKKEYAFYQNKASGNWYVFNNLGDADEIILHVFGLSDNDISSTNQVTEQQRNQYLEHAETFILKLK